MLLDGDSRRSWFPVAPTPAAQPPPPAVDTVNSSAAGLNHSLTLNATGGTGTASPQGYSVTGSIPAGQAGTCATGNCSATQAHTVYIGF